MAVSEYSPPRISCERVAFLVALKVRSRAMDHRRPMLIRQWALG
jgi:hypothetical protein